MSSYMINPTGDASAMSSNLTRAQWQMFMDRYRPIEEQAFNQINRDIEPEVQQAGQYIDRAYQGLDGARSREFGRQGLQAGGDVENVMKRRAGLQRAMDIAGTENNIRTGFKDQQTNNLSTMIGIGKGVAGSASGALSSASGMQTQRKMANDQLSAQRSAQNQQMAGSAIGLMAMMMM